MTTSAISLTDPPEIVKLKEEFRKLDEREEELKRLCLFNDLNTPLELIEVRRRKSQIAHEIFGTNPQAIQ